MAKMEAHAHQNSAKAASSIKKQYLSTGDYMMEAKSAQLLVSFGQAKAKASGQH